MWLTRVEAERLVGKVPTAPYYAGRWVERGERTFDVVDPVTEPWGGSKLSGHGRGLGWSGIVANTEEKTVTVVL